MHFSTKLALRAGVLSVAAASAIVIPASAALAAGPTVQVTPNSGLTDAQTVSVSGSGFTNTNTAATIIQCSGNPATATPADCDTSNIGGGPVDGSGNLAATNYTVHTGPIGTNGGKCPATGSGNLCFIAVSTDGGGADSSAAPITFAAVPTITVNPDKGVKNGQNVRVSGKHFPHNMTIYVVECGGTSGQANCDLSTVNLSSKTNGSGSFSGVKVKVHTGNVGNKKCKAGGKCFIAASTSQTGDPAQSATAKFTFAKASSKLKTKTTASAKGSKVAGKVKAHGKGVKGLKVVLDMKHGKHWKKVDNSKTKKGGKFHFTKLSSGKYEVKTPKQHKGGKTYKGSHSKPVHVKAGGGGGSSNCPGCVFA